MALSQTEFIALVDAHGPALYRVAYRLTGDAHDAEDLVQETFRSVWKGRAGYEPGRGDRAWLTCILRRRVVDWWRKRQRPDAVSPHEMPDVGMAGPDPAADEYSDKVQAALNVLPRELRETLLLVVVGELTHQEVADLLQVPLGTVLSRVNRARRKLRQLLVPAART
ncbi:MAG: RNA polymerase sigma factor [Pirellulaceae bacterium]|nr:RNA polymerase sigma factor [Pirellulaceae bacterium]